MVNKADRDPHHHTQKIYPLQDVMDHLREDVGKVDKLQLKAMFGAAADDHSEPSFAMPLIRAITSL